jgi:hypothetical protein
LKGDTSGPRIEVHYLDPSMENCSTPGKDLQAISHAKKRTTLYKTLKYCLFGGWQAIICVFPHFTDVWLPNPNEN